ncbi:hypothetical protein N665_0218s0098 [Sinapis alba]|nr:hypothetical protein N665_0218s0098 [Sinapis alba]
MSIRNFWLSAYRLLGKCLKQIERLCSAFLWTGPELKTSSAKAAWQEVSKSLWSQWIHKNLLKRKSLWELKGKSQLGSWMWKKLLKIRHKAQTFYKEEIGNGRNTYFWHDCWSELGVLSKLLGDRGKNEVSLLRSKVGYKTQFSSQETWCLIREDREKCSWIWGVWFPKVTPKFAFITWLSMLDCLSTMYRVSRWMNGVDQVCVLCNSSLESQDHMFFECSYSSEVWEYLIKGILKRSNSPQWLEVKKIVSENNRAVEKGCCLRYAMQSAINALWRERNRRRHGEPHTQVQVFKKIVEKSI